MIRQGNCYVREFRGGSHWRTRRGRVGLVPGALHLLLIPVALLVAVLSLAALPLLGFLDEVRGR